MAMHVVRNKVEATVATWLRAKLHHVGHRGTEQAAKRYEGKHIESIIDWLIRHA